MPIANSRMRAIRGVRIPRRGVAVFLALCALTAGCGSGKFFVPTCQEQGNCTSGGGGGNGTYDSYAYVANATTGSIALFAIPTGTFTSLTAATTALGAAPSAIAGTPSGTFLYLATAAGPTLVYTIGTNGVLTLGNSGNPVVTTGFAPTSMVVDPSGNFLFIVSSTSPVLFEYQINTSTGTLTAINGQGTALDSGTPKQVYVTPNDAAVYVALSGGGVDTFAFNSSTGALSNQQHLTVRTAGAGDNAIAADNNSAYLFVGEAGTGIRAFSIGATGGLSEISGSPFAQSQLGPSSIIVDPTNTYVYVANRTSNNITGYSLATSGALKALSSSPFTTGATPVAMALDSTGTYLFVINNGGSPDLQVFSFDATVGGKLDSVTTASTGTDPTGPISLAVVP